MGLSGTFVYGLWQIFYTIPNAQELIIKEVISKHGNIVIIISCYIFLIINNLMHALCFFRLLSSLGSTTVGVLKGAQSVSVFVLSHFLFCSFQISQCFTILKGISLIVVVSGVLLYSIDCRSRKFNSEIDVTSSLSFLEVDELNLIPVKKYSAINNKN